MSNTVLAILLGLAFIIWRIGRQIWSTYQHVDEETLSDFWVGRLQRENREEYKRVQSHLTHCEQCRDALDHIRQTERREEEKIITRRF